MSTVILSDAQRQQVLAATGDIEFRDANGNLLVRVPKHRTLDELKALYPEGAWASDEELDRRSKAGGGYTTDQVIAHLRGLSQ